MFLNKSFVFIFSIIFSLSLSAAEHNDSDASFGYLSKDVGRDSAMGDSIPATPAVMTPQQSESGRASLVVSDLMNESIIPFAQVSKQLTEVIAPVAQRAKNILEGKKAIAAVNRHFSSGLVFKRNK